MAKYHFLMSLKNPASECLILRNYEKSVFSFRQNTEISTDVLTFTRHYGTYILIWRVNSIAYGVTAMYIFAN